MNIYVFGNEDVDTDSSPLQLLEKLKSDYKELTFIEIKPNQEVDFIDEPIVHILDSVSGISEPTLLDETAIDSISANASSTVHDYDLGFQLKYLKKLGKINKVRILGVPMNTNVDYKTFQFIFKKFVAQDIQGS